jgi:hypothetical protein
LYIVAIFSVLSQIGETAGIIDQYLTRKDHDPELSPFQHYFAFFRHFIEPLFDFFTAFTLLALFYLLSIKAI